ncbi:MAG: ZIP family metal transporter [Clostridia bacterium]|nr:ZIP family metal transporter [Clostridia bacterium]
MLGSACVFFTKGKINLSLQKALNGFAAGVMVAASVWSLLIPAIEQSESYGMFSFVPAVVGFWLGVLFLLVLDKIIPVNSRSTKGMLFLAVTLHNFPEGMAVGVVFSGLLAGNPAITPAVAMALSIGIAIQNFPEGAIISMPLAAEGESKFTAFLKGTLSGVVEPIGALLTIIAASIVVPILPYFLSFAAGAMIYVVTQELLTRDDAEKPSYAGTLMFAAGFTVMMILDVTLG